MAEEIQPYLEYGLVQEALAKIAEKFASPDHDRPIHVADFDNTTDPKQCSRLQLDAYERVNILISRLLPK